MRRRAAIPAVIVFAAGAAYLLRNGIAHPDAERTDQCTGNSIAAVAVHPIIDARTREGIFDEIASRGTLIVQDGAYADTTPLLIGAAPRRSRTLTLVSFGGSPPSRPWWAGSRMLGPKPPHSVPDRAGFVIP
jgi:hypothetical protein